MHGGIALLPNESKSFSLICLVDQLPSHVCMHFFILDHLHHVILFVCQIWVRILDLVLPNGRNPIVSIRVSGIVECISNIITVLISLADVIDKDTPYFYIITPLTHRTNLKPMLSQGCFLLSRTSGCWMMSEMVIY